MLRFKEWFESILPKPVTVFGQKASSTEEFDDISDKYFGARYKDYEQIKKDASADLPGEGSAPDIRGPYFGRVQSLLDFLDADNYISLMNVIDKDPLAHKWFRELQTPDVTLSDVKGFLINLRRIGIWKRKKGIIGGAHSGIRVIPNATA